MDISLKKASSQDSFFFLNLRNSNRKNFLNSKKIDFNNHHTWFKQALSKKNKFFYKIIFKKKDSGYIRIEKIKKNYFVSICVDKKFRKKNLAFNALANVEKRILDKGIMHSVVKKNNIASKKLFLKSGYSVYKKNKLCIFMKKKNNKLKIIDQIEKIRKNNNVNWMNLLRLAYKKSPNESALIMSKIYKDDEKISKLVKKLINN